MLLSDAMEPITLNPHAAPFYPHVTVRADSVMGRKAKLMRTVRRTSSNGPRFTMPTEYLSTLHQTGEDESILRNDVVQFIQNSSVLRKALKMYAIVSLWVENEEGKDERLVLSISPRIHQEVHTHADSMVWVMDRDDLCDGQRVYAKRPSRGGFDELVDVSNETLSDAEQLPTYILENYPQCVFTSGKSHSIMSVWKHMDRVFFSVGDSVHRYVTNDNVVSIHIV